MKGDLQISLWKIRRVWQCHTLHEGGRSSSRPVGGKGIESANPLVESRQTTCISKIGAACPMLVIGAPTCCPGLVCAPTPDLNVSPLIEIRGGVHEAHCDL